MDRAVDRRQIEKTVAETIEATSPFESGFHNSGEPTETAIRVTERRLRGFPELCRQERAADGAEVVTLNREIKRVKGALELISKDPYYRIIPDFFFNGYSNREVARGLNCDMTTMHRNKRRLIEKIALFLYGVEAWTM